MVQYAKKLNDKQAKANGDKQSDKESTATTQSEKDEGHTHGKENHHLDKKFVSLLEDVFGKGNIKTEMVDGCGSHKSHCDDSCGHEDGCHKPLNDYVSTCLGLSKPNDYLAELVGF